MKITRFITIGLAGILLAVGALAATRSFTILSPAGGEQWILGTAHTINPQFNGSSQLNPTDLIGIYLEGASGQIKIGAVLYKPPFNWVVGKTISSSGGVGVAINTPVGQYTMKLVYPWDDLAGTSGVHAEGTSNTFQIIPVPTATPKPSSTPGVTKTPTPVATAKPVAGACTDGATITSSDLPLTISLAPGATQVFHTNVTNTGNTNWTDGAYYQLLNSSSQNLLSPPNGHLPNVVSVNGTVSWSFAITAPTTPGSYPINLQMVHLSGGVYIKSTGAKCAAPTSNMPFGQTLATTVQVIAPSATPSPSTAPIPPVDTSNWFMDNLTLIGLGILLLLAVIGGAWWLIRSRANAGMVVPPTIPPTAPPEIPPSAPTPPTTP